MQKMFFSHYFEWHPNVQWLSVLECHCRCGWPLNSFYEELTPPCLEVLPQANTLRECLNAGWSVFVPVSAVQEGSLLLRKPMHYLGVYFLCLCFCRRRWKSMVLRMCSA